MKQSTPLQAGLSPVVKTPLPLNGNFNALESLLLPPAVIPDQERFALGCLISTIPPPRFEILHLISGDIPSLASFTLRR